MTNEVIRLSLTLKEVDVVLFNSDDEEKNYKLKELNGKERNKYLNKMKDRVNVGADGKTVRIKSFDGMQADLLMTSLSNETGEAVSKEEIEALPSSAQQKLFELAQELSGLDNEKESDEKNV